MGEDNSKWTPEFAHSAEAAARRTSFGAWAGDYDKFRPGYPPEVVEHLLSCLGPSPLIADIGAGTGQLSRGLVAAGARVIAVEPDARMRAELVKAVGADAARAGTAEELPLADAVADGVFGSQMWHWTDPVKALPEIARVLRPGGRFSVVWNIRDTSVSWVRAMNEIVPLPASQLWCEANPEPQFEGPFSGVERWEFAYSQPSTQEQLVGLISTLSPVQVSDRTSEILDGVRQLTVTHEDLAGRDVFDIPYVYRVFSASRL